MFNKEFYPTPENIINMMGIDCLDKIVLEPSAGKGNIVKWLNDNGAKEVIACEKNIDLAEIVKTKARFIEHDFLKVTPEQVSHIDMIVMNPPFSADETHILHAFEIAPGGCEIIALCNWKTIELSNYTRSRKQLKRNIEDYGQCEYLGDVFSDAERKTGVEIGLIKLFKPKQGANEFDGFFMDEDEEQPQENGIMQFDAIRDVVQRYVYAVKCYDEHEIVNNKMMELTKPFGIGGFKIEIGYNDTVSTREDFKKHLQKKAWHYLFNLMNLNKYLTSGVMKDINAFVEKQTKVPFTMRNIYKMFEIIVGTREQIFDRALAEAVDKFTMHTHENRYNVEGWKTNSGHMLNKKFILEYMFEPSYRGGLTVKHSGNADKLDDLIKVLCSITGTDYKTVKSLRYDGDLKYYEPNTWYSWDLKKTIGEGENQTFETLPGFFEFKGFKKGTMHLKFKDDKVWETLNRRYAKIKGQVLPEKMRL